MHPDDLHALSLDDLHDLARRVQAEIATRCSPDVHILWTHPCQTASRHHLGKYKHWAKHVIAVDRFKTTGYAWQGDFLRVEAEHLLPPGSVVAWVCDDSLAVIEITADGPRDVGSTSTRSQYALITEVADRFFKV